MKKKIELPIKIGSVVRHRHNDHTDYLVFDINHDQFSVLWSWDHVTGHIYVQEDGTIDFNTQQRWHKNYFIILL